MQDDQNNNQSEEQTDSTEIPIIRAPEGPYKVRPEGYEEDIPVIEAPEGPYKVRPEGYEEDIPVIEAPEGPYKVRPEGFETEEATEPPTSSNLPPTPKTDDPSKLIS